MAVPMSLPQLCLDAAGALHRGVVSLFTAFVATGVPFTLASESTASPTQPPWGASIGQGLPEPELKAAAFYNVVTFTEWPSSTFASADAPLVIGILGEGPVATLLDALVANETWHGRRLLVKHFAVPAAVRDCHVLFIARSAAGRWRTMSRQFAKRPILTISDADDFARHGGVVQLGIDRNKLRLTVNLAAARNNGLAISSKVLRLAEIIDDRGR